MTRPREDELRGLLARGRAYAEAGDARAAASFFAAALRSAGQAVPAPLAAEVQEARAYLERTKQAYAAHLERAIAAADAGPRMDEAFDIMLGRRGVEPRRVPYPQRPSAFYFPGLPQRPFYEREAFPWAARVEAASAAIRAEAQALLDRGESFAPYVQAEKNRPQRDFHGMQDDPSWGAFYLWKDGERIAENAARCPATMAALEGVPLTQIPGRTPSVLFSLLRPGAHIPPHHGMLNCRLICHLPLIVPPGCWLRVGGETRQWEDGKLLIFDDSIEHEAKNGSERLRLVLLFDIWRPELSEAERAAVAAMFTAIDAFAAPAAAQRDA
ncbi:MAG TPA: aspartyl/asparaginyl beta-hydroxylase domain-containing protein [Allosphingosinicella sp.]|nr:aspartyl/asparaginyl beta-hydroxylase domain-containing protein [Allosphingosinicella sp.]